MFYPEGEPGSERALLRNIYVRHCRSVAELALQIASRLNLNVDLYEVEAAAMLHDIGVALTDAPGIHCHGTEPYLAHGAIGARMLRELGVPERIARVAERHTGSGLTSDDIARIGLPEFDATRSYMPETLLERLICYADKFFSKSGDMQKKPLAKVRASIARFGADAAERFERLHKEFGENAEA